MEQTEDKDPEEDADDDDDEFVKRRGKKRKKKNRQPSGGPPGFEVSLDPETQVYCPSNLFVKS